jgi:hypothetical protein
LKISQERLWTLDDHKYTVNRSWPHQTVVGTTDPKGPSLPRFLVEEIPATDGLPVWRRDDQKGALALRLTAGGLAGIGAGQDTEEDTAQTPIGANLPSCFLESNVIPA